MSMEPYDNIPLPSDWNQPAEWVEARLMYPNHPEARFARGFGRRMDWREGGTSWTQDYPRACTRSPIRCRERWMGERQRNEEEAPSRLHESTSAFVYVQVTRYRTIGFNVS